MFIPLTYECHSRESGNPVINKSVILSRRRRIQDFFFPSTFDIQYSIFDILSSRLPTLVPRPLSKH